MTRRSLHVWSREEEGLGRPTIMDRALAAKHGIPYVHLAAFSIDVDRAFESFAYDTDSTLPFGWEVLLTETYLLERFDPSKDDERIIVEDACISVLEEEPGEAVLGTQLPFAVYDATRRKIWPPELAVTFTQWRKPPDRLVRELGRLWESDPREHARLFARACLGAKLSPPLAPPTVEALRAMIAR